MIIFLDTDRVDNQQRKEEGSSLHSPESASVGVSNVRQITMQSFSSRGDGYRHFSYNRTKAGKKKNSLKSAVSQLVSHTFWCRKTSLDAKYVWHYTRVKCKRGKIYGARCEWEVIVTWMKYITRYMCVYMRNGCGLNKLTGRSMTEVVYVLDDATFGTCMRRLECQPTWATAIPASNIHGTIDFHPHYPLYFSPLHSNTTLN